MSHPLVAFPRIRKPASMISIASKEKRVNGIAFPDGGSSMDSEAFSASPPSPLSSIPCNLCGGTVVKTLATRGRNNKPLRTVICSNCGLVWSDPVPYNPRQFYETEYRHEYKGTYRPKPKHVLRAGQVALSRYQHVHGIVPEGGTILDVGSGGGEFLYLLRTKGYQVKGVEPNVGYAQYSVSEYGLDIQVGFIQDAVIQEEFFDAITIWHVLEHTDDPGHVLDILYEAVKPGGVVIVEVPNVEAVCQSPTSTFHEAHIFNFNAETLRVMMEKAGFSPVSIVISDDGGNITLTAKKLPDSIRRTPDEIRQPDNADRIIGTVEDHTLSRFWRSRNPYVRLSRRIIRMAKEKIRARKYADGKAILDDLYRECISRPFFQRGA